MAYFSFILIILTLFNIPAFATNSENNSSKDITYWPLNNQLFSQCQDLLKNCPKKSQYYDYNCMMQIVKSNKICFYQRFFNNRLHASPQQISISAMGNNFFTVTIYYPADDKKHYYLLTPKGKLIDTIPTSLFPKGEALWIEAQSAPRYISTRNVFFIPLVIKDSCVACQEKTKEQIAFFFNNQNELISISKLSSGSSR